MFIEPPNAYCNAEIRPNTDIGGRGVMASFLIVSWLTVLLAAVPAVHEAKSALNQWHCRGPSTRQYLDREIQAAPTRPGPDLFRIRIFFLQASEQRIINSEPKIVQKINALFGPLCDLQAMTGVAIMIAGFTQWHTITYYHEQLIMCYWWLTLNSFWVARINYMNLGSIDDQWILRIRRGSILVSCLLAITWLIRITYRELDHWDDNGGPCYRFLDGTSTWPWVGGLILFSIALSSVLLEKTRVLNETYFFYTEKARDRLLTWLEDSRQRRKDALQKFKGSGKARIISPVSRRQCVLCVLFTARMQVEVAIAALSVGLYWFLLQWLATWSYGDGFYPFTWLIYIGFNVWSTLDVISLWAWNKSLISTEEQGWGFGQVLPIILLSSIGIDALNIFRG